MLFEQLQDYLEYMTDLQYSGLQLTHQPFKLAKPSTTRIQTDPYQPGQHHRAPPPRQRVAEPKKSPQKIQKPAKAQNLFSLVDLVDMGSSGQDNREKAQAIGGKDANEILNNLYNAFKDCEACPLGTTRTKFVFGEGPPDASLMFVGEGPGRDEDLSGRPFVGRAGQLLDKIIEAMGFQRDQVFIANVVKCRPPGNRTPLPDEMTACSPILKRQIEAVNPKITVVLGATALKHFVGSSASIMRMRGTFFEWEGRQVMPTFHPAYILRNPRAKREVWEDMKQVMNAMKS